MTRRVVFSLGALLALGVSVVPARASADAYVFTRGGGYTYGMHELVTPTMVVTQGAGLVLVNMHLWGHSVTSDAWSGEQRLFTSDVIPFRNTSRVRGVESLDPGTYGFFCRNHMGMRGSLIVVGTT